MHWRNAGPGELATNVPAWLAIERDIQGFSLPFLLFAENKPTRHFKKCNPIIVNSLKIWYQIRRIFNFPQTCCLTPIARNHTFFLSQTAFLSWKEKGIITIGDLYIDNIFATFNQLRQKF